MFLIETGGNIFTRHFTHFVKVRTRCHLRIYNKSFNENSQVPSENDNVPTSRRG